MKDFWEEPKTKKVNKKRIFIAIIIVILIISAIAISAVYVYNPEVREWIDKKILRKEVVQDTTVTINVEENSNSNIYAFNKYIGILSKNEFKIYNNVGKEEKSLSVEVDNPLFNCANRFLAIAQNGGQKLYLITDKDLSWESKIEGEISQIHVNKNGYVAVTIVNTIHKTVVEVFNPQGTEMFKIYLASTRATDVCISNDNKYLAVAEIDTSGTLINSNIKIVSIEKAQTDPTNSVVETYSGKENGLITNIKYQDKGNLVYMYTDAINIISNGKDTEITNNSDKKITFQSIELSNNVVTVEERSSGLFTADSIVDITNIDNKNVNEYKSSTIAKEIFTNGDIIALNYGSEIEFINTSGWLAKRYIANQEIRNIKISSNIAAIIYRDKIEIINL